MFFTSSRGGSAALAVAVLTLSLAACNSGKEDAGSGSTNQSGPLKIYYM